MISMFAKRATLVLVSLACTTLGCNGNTILTQAPTNTELPKSEFPTDLTINPDAIPPADVLEQVDFLVPASGYYSCTEGKTGARDPLPIGEPIEWCFCTIKDGETFTVKLVDPNGAVVKQADFKAYISDLFPCDEGNFSRNLLLPGAPLGVYALQFITPESTVVVPFTLIPAQKPTILDTKTGRVLTGFRPNETIRLLAYKYFPGELGLKFVGEGWIQADQDGQFNLEIDPEIALYAIGTQSGEAAPVTDDGQHSFARIWVKYSGPLDNSASVEAGEELPVYSLPSNQNPAVASLPAGTRLLTTRGPFSNNGTFWWQVESETGTQGWADERLLKLVDYEPNDTLEKAADLFMFDSGAYSYNYYSKLPLGSADRDFYRLPLRAGSISVSVRLDGEKTMSTPMGMVLYDDSGHILGEKSTTGQDHSLYLFLTVPKDGTYFVEVYDNGIAQPIEYTLSIQ